jgi:hypothetical protein
VATNAPHLNSMESPRSSSPPVICYLIAVIPSPLSILTTLFSLLAFFSTPKYNISYGDIFPEPCLRWYHFSFRWITLDNRFFLVS